MKDLMNVKLFLKNNISWCAAYNCINSSKNNPDKTFFILPKNECNRKAALKRTLLFNVSTLTSNQLSTEHCPNLIVLLCTA